LSIATKEAEAIAQLMAGYVDIILKKRKDTGFVLYFFSPLLHSLRNVG
jgi:hypothetical protein